MNQAGSVPLACLEKTHNLYQSQKIKLFSFKFSVFIYVGTLDFYVSVSDIQVSMVTAMYRTFIVNCISIYSIGLFQHRVCMYTYVHTCMNISAMHALDTMIHVVLYQ